MDTDGADIDGEAANDHSGWSVALSSDGTILAVGAWLNDGNGYDSDTYGCTNGQVDHGLSWVLILTGKQQVIKVAHLLR